MSTRSNIAKVNDNGTVSVIYCHYDGYVNGVGKILAEHYTDEAKVDELIELGDLSILGKEIGEKHDFDATINPNWTKAYGRDRGEADVYAAVYTSVDEYIHDVDSDDAIEYVYVFGNGEWTVYSNHLVVSPVLLK